MDLNLYGFCWFLVRGYPNEACNHSIIAALDKMFTTRWILEIPESEIGTHFTLSQLAEFSKHQAFGKLKGEGTLEENLNPIFLSTEQRYIQH